MKKVDEIKNKSIPVFNDYNVLSASLFGSMARGDDKKNSDIDFLIKFSPDSGGLFVMVRLKRSLEKALKRKVDLLTYRSLNPHLKKYIMNDAIKIYEKK